ncbi:MAG: ExbD/TolR family protein [Brachymonas sp.]|uniref:ExbD/TolR family protein n=1 Tax=unclassified Brachymonas TaxID=2621329 RepID=UPI0035B3F357
MKFRTRPREEPEINLIPFIDVLLVILIFLMLTTTYSKFNELQLQLPVASADATREHPKEIIVSVAADGQYAVNQSVLDDRSPAALTQALQQLQASPDSTLIISADAHSTHQAVITVMEVARSLGLTRVTFATQKAAQ